MNIDTFALRWEMGAQGAGAGGTTPMAKGIVLPGKPGQHPIPVGGVDALNFPSNSVNRPGLIQPVPLLSGETGKASTAAAAGGRTTGSSRLTPLGLPHPVPLRPSSGRPTSDSDKSTPSSGSSHSQEAAQPPTKSPPPTVPMQRSPPQLPPLPPAGGTAAMSGAPPLLPSICRSKVDPGVAESENERHWADVQQDDPCPTFLAAVSHMSPPPTQQGQLYLQLFTKTRRSDSTAETVRNPARPQGTTENRIQEVYGPNKDSTPDQPLYILCDCALNGEELLVVPRPQQISIQERSKRISSASTALVPPASGTALKEGCNSTTSKLTSTASGKTATPAGHEVTQLPYPFRISLKSTQGGFGSAATELADYRECRQHWAFLVHSHLKPQFDMGLADSISGEFLQISSLPWSRNVVPWAPKSKRLQLQENSSGQRQRPSAAVQKGEGTLSQFPYVIHFRAPNYSELVDWVEALRGATSFSTLGRGKGWF